MQIAQTLDEERMPDPSKTVETKPVRVPGATKRLQRLASSLKSAAVESRGYVFMPSPEAIAGLRKREKKIESIELGDAGEGGTLLKLANGDPEAKSNGPTEGFSIRVPETFEREVSAKMVRVQVLARSASPEATRLAIAYSTNEVGNSRWRWRSVKPTWGLCKMDWKVPQMKEGHGDFIGILPDKHGAPGVEIYSVSATIIESVSG